MVTDIEINPNDTSLIYMACGNFTSMGHGLYRSLDGGNNWSKMTNGLPNKYGGKALLSMSRTDPGIIYAGIGNGYTSSAGTWLCKTIDGGDNWTVLNDTNYSSYQGWFSHDVAVYPLDHDTVLCFGVYGWRSDDGGESLNRITSIGEGTNIHVDFHALEFQPGSPRTFYIASDGGIYRSQDLGESFDRLDNGLQTTQFYNGFSNSHQDPYMALGGLQDNGTYSYNGSKNWIFQSGGDGAWTAIDPGNDEILYVSYQYLRIRKSTNRGINFTNIFPPETGSVSFIAPYVLAPGLPNTIYAGRSFVFKSTNGGMSWGITNQAKELDGNPVLSMAVSYQSANVVYAATAPRYGYMNVFVSLNGGSSWNNIKGNLPERYPIDLAVNPTNDAEVYIALSGFGSAHLYKSLNRGSSWENISNSLPDVPASAVIVDPVYPAHVFFGNDLGVYFSNNGGESWESFSNGLPEAVIVKDLSISPVNRKLRVATHGNGSYEIDLPVGSTNIYDYNNISVGLKLFPNPVDDILNIEYFSQNNQSGLITIRNVKGETVYSSTKDLNSGLNRLVISGLDIAPGMYFLELKQGNVISNAKLLKIN